MSIRRNVLHFYRAARAHQAAVYADGGGMRTTFPSVAGFQQRTELSYGSAPYGEHAVSAYRGALHTIAWRRQFAADQKLHRKRSRAAKRGWKTRRDNALDAEYDHALFLHRMGIDR